MSKRKFSRLAFCLAATLLTTSCAMPKVKMYDGRRLQAAEEATILVERGNRLGRLNISQVDGNRTVDAFTLAFTRKLASDVYVLPGTHIVGVGIEKNT